MKYSAIDTQAVQLQNVSSGGTGEITINLHLTKPSIEVEKTTYISGVYGENGNLNPNPPLCSVDSYNSTILNNVKKISATEGSEITLILNTKYNEITGN